MCIYKKFLVAGLVLICSGTVFGADVILNEYNAVDNIYFLNVGTAAVDAVSKATAATGLNWL